MKQRRVLRTFSFSPNDDVLLNEAQHRFCMEARIVNYSETVRAGLLALLQISAHELRDIEEKLLRLKPGKERKTPGRR